MSKQITLKDIAADLNISRTTVHRALHGKDGISDQLRSVILNRAKEMGYSGNYIASSLKRKTIQLAVVLPEREGTGRFYHKYFWDSIEAFRPEAHSLNVDIAFHSFDEESGNQIQVLEGIFNGGQTEFDGLLTMPAKCNEEMRRTIERFSDKGIPVVLIDNDLPGSGRLCCVAPHDRQTGRLGAELLSAISPQEGKVLIAAGKPEHGSHVNNLEGFQEYLAQTGKKLELLVIQSHSDYQRCYDEAVRHLKDNDDIVAFYSVTARDTIPLTRAVIDCGMAGSLKGVGSDLYPDSAELLQQDALQALIYKNAYDKGHLGFRILFSYVVKNIPPKAESVTVPISIIMKNNLHFFRNRI